MHHQDATLLRVGAANAGFYCFFFGLMMSRDLRSTLDAITARIFNLLQRHHATMATKRQTLFDRFTNITPSQSHIPQQDEPLPHLPLTIKSFSIPIQINIIIIIIIIIIYFGTVSGALHMYLKEIFFSGKFSAFAVYIMFAAR
jgi:hypothetical protein